MPVEQILRSIRYLVFMPVQGLVQLKTQGLKGDDDPDQGICFMLTAKLRTPATGLGLGALLAVTACAPDDTAVTEDETSPEPTVTETVTEEPEDTQAEEPEAEETGQEEPEEATDAVPDEPGAGESDLPPGGTDRLDEITEDGEPFDAHTGVSAEAAEGEEAGVAGLSDDDAPLEVRGAPSHDAELVAELGQLDALLLGGRGWLPPDEAEEQSSWTEIQLADGYGWVQGSIYFFGRTEDVTETYIDDVPPAEEEHQIARSVAEEAAEGEDLTDDESEPLGPDWEMISSPQDYGEDFYRMDVLGMLDDSVAGERLFVHVDQVSDGFQLSQVERTVICHRGVSDDGRCV